MVKTYQQIIRDHYKRIGAMGGRAGRGASKVRTHTKAAMLRYWDRVRSGELPPPKGKTIQMVFPYV